MNHLLGKRRGWYLHVQNASGKWALTSIQNIIFSLAMVLVAIAKECQRFHRPDRAKLEVIP